MTETILIVDDSSFIVEGLVTILKKSFRPLAVYSGQECLDILKKERPAIIILDIMMEPMDGWETLSKIKENPATQQIPVLMFSAKKISAEEAEEHRISIDDFVSKPVNTKKLIESIEKVLARQKANRLNIGSWQSAGIGQDRIDEFTSLVTNLEVDMSLLQNMKVQLSLVHDDDNKSRMDFEAVIAAIESRIEEERRHEEELSNEMQKSVAKGAVAKEHAGTVPAINKKGLESLPPVTGTESASQKVFVNSYGDFKDETNSSDTEVFLKKVSVSHTNTVSEITPIAEVRLPDTVMIPETFDSDFLFESEESKKSYSENSDQEILVESLVYDPGHDPVQSGLSSGIESQKINRVIHQKFLETPEGTAGDRVNISSDKKVPVYGQKNPVIYDTPPISVNPPARKPVVTVAPIQTVVGSGTDISLRLSPSSLGRTKGTTTDNPFMPVEKVSSPSGGFFSKIISMILGIFKRK